MPENPTIPPAPKRAQPKPIRIPPVVEEFHPKAKSIDPYRGINRVPVIEQPKRHYTPSELDVTTARHHEQLRGLERRVDDLEDVSGSMDQKMDEALELIRNERQARELAETVKQLEKTNEDQKTKRLQAILIAIPLIVSPFLGFFGSYMGKDTSVDKFVPTTVVVSEYNQDAAKCKETKKSKEAFIQCIRDAQLKSTPIFDE